MSLNIKDAYDSIIKEHLYNNPPYKCKNQYAAICSFKSALDEYAKEKLEAFIDDHFPEDSVLPKKDNRLDRVRD